MSVQVVARSRLAFAVLALVALAPTALALAPGAVPDLVEAPADATAEAPAVVRDPLSGDVAVVESAPLDLAPLLEGLPADAPAADIEKAVGDAFAPAAPPPSPLLQRLDRVREGFAALRPLLAPPPTEALPVLPVPVPVIAFPQAPALAPEPAAAPAAPALAAASLAGSAALSAAVSPPFLARLFSRLERGEALTHPMRRRVYESIASAPGVSPTDLRRALGLGNGALLHHLDVLHREGLVTRVDGGRFVRLFVTGSHSPREMRARATVMRGSAERVLEVVKAQPGLPVREAATAVGLSVASVHRTLERLEREGLVERRREGRGHVVYPAAAPLAA